MNRAPPNPPSRWRAASRWFSRLTWFAAANLFAWSAVHAALTDGDAARMVAGLGLAALCFVRFGLLLREPAARTPRPGRRP